MTEQDTRDEEREDLSGGHDNGKDYRPKLLNGVEDEQLSSGGGNGQHHHVHEGTAVGHDEGQRREELSRLVQSEAGHDHRPNVDTKHHLILVNAILLVDLTLPLGGE